MKDMSINQKKWAEGISKRNLVRLYFSFRQLHVPRETKIAALLKRGSRVRVKGKGRGSRVRVEGKG